MSSDRNLLVGILALQMGFVDQSQLIDAMQKWLLAKDLGIEDIFEEKGLVDSRKKEFLAMIAQQHLELHNDNIADSLATLSSVVSVKRQLLDLNDPEIDRTIDSFDAAENESSAEAVCTLDNDDETTQDVRVNVDRIAGKRFRLLKFHARGGLGTVWVAEDLELNRQVAVKEIQPKLVADESNRQRFLAEAEITGRLEHPNIVPVYSLGETSSGGPFYAMRFIRGSSLSDAIKQFHDSSIVMEESERTLFLRKLVGNIVSACNAVDYAHSRGILHRDLKPANIMLGKYGETLVVDWGLAKAVGHSRGDRPDEATVVPQSGDSSSMTTLGSVIGTLSYMSPEQAEGRIDELGPASDVYCLGSTLYAILTGKAPIHTSRTDEMVQAIKTGNYPRLKEVKPTADSALTAICEKAMKLNPRDRYPTAAALTEDLERWLAGEPVNAYPEPMTVRMRRFLVKHRSIAAGVAASIVVGLISLGALTAVTSKKNADLRVAYKSISDANAEVLGQQQQLMLTVDSLRTLAYDMLIAAENKLRNIPDVDPFRQEVMDKSFNTLVQLRDEHPDNQGIAETLYKTARLSANQLARLGNYSDAENRMLLSVALQHTFLTDEESRETILLYLVDTYKDLIGIQQNSTTVAEIRKSIVEMEALLVELRASKVPKSTLIRLESQSELATLGFFEQIDDTEKGLEVASRIAAQYQQILGTEIEVPNDAVISSLIAAWYGRMLCANERFEESTNVFADATQMAEAKLAKYSNSRNWLYAVARLKHWHTDRDLSAQQIDAGSLIRIQNAVELFQAIHTANPNLDGFRFNLAVARTTYGKALMQLGQESPGEQFDSAIEILASLLEKTPSADNAEALVRASIARAEFLLAKNLDAAQAASDLEVAEGVIDRTLTRDPEFTLLQKLKAEIAKLKMKAAQP